MQPTRDPEEARPRFARRSPLSPSPKLCPRCLSPLNSGSKLGGWLIPMSYYCTKCGYTGTAFLEKDTDSPPPGKE